MGRSPVHYYEVIIHRRGRFIPERVVVRTTETQAAKLKYMIESSLSQGFINYGSIQQLFDEQLVTTESYIHELLKDAIKDSMDCVVIESANLVNKPF